MLRSARTRFAALGTAATILATLLTVFTPAVAANATTYSVKFTVTAGGQPVSDALVELIPVNSSDYSRYKWAWSGADGKVSFSNVKSGKYRGLAELNYATFGSGVSALDYAPTLLGSSLGYRSDSVGSFTVSSSKSLALPLLPGFTISGNVTAGPDPAVPAGGIVEVSLRTDPEELENVGYPEGSYEIDSDTGAYIAGGFAPGDYALQYFPESSTDYGWTYYGDTNLLGDSPSVTVVDTSVTGIDAHYGTGTEISGELSLSNDDGIADLLPWISLIDQDGDYLQDADVDGTSYSFTNVPDGTYYLNADPDSTGDPDVDGTEHNYHSEWWNDSASFEGATPIVTTGAPVTADIEFDSGFSVTGTLTDYLGHPIPDVEVDFEGDYSDDDEDYPFGSAITDENGYYEIDDLAPGDYDASFGIGENDSRYEYWVYYGDGGVPASSYESAAKISHRGGTYDYSLQLDQPTWLDVHVATAAGTPLKRADVLVDTIVDGEIGSSNEDYYDSATEISSGVYRIPGLDPGTVYLPIVYPYESSKPAQYAGGAESSDVANRTTAQLGGNDIYLTLAPLPSISGTVTWSSGKAAKGAWVYAYEFDGNDWVYSDSYARVNSKGKWSISGLEAGSYRFEIESSSYTQWYGGATLDDATSVYISPGTTAKASIVIRPAGKLTGSFDVSNPSRELGYVYPVRLIGTPGAFTDSVDVNDESEVSATGKFRFDSLEPGYYALRYEYYEISGTGSSALAFTSAFAGGADALTATPFLVTASKTTTVPAITIGDTAFGTVSVSGVVSTASGPLVADDFVYVVLESATPGQRSLYTNASGDGSYGFETVLAGDYTLVAFSFYSLFGEGGIYTAPITVGTDPVVHDVVLPDAEELVFTVNPSISGEEKVGSTLTLDPGTTNLSSTTDVRWYRMTDGDPASARVIRGAGGETYDLKPADFGATVFARVTATHTISVLGSPFSTLDATAKASSGEIGMGEAAINVDPPTFTPSSAVATDTVARARPGTWSVSGTRYEYQWLSDGNPIAGATASTYVVPAELVGTELSVEVRALRDNTAASDWAESSAAAVGLADGPTLSKAPTVKSVAASGGHTYSVVGGSWNGSPTEHSYTWLVDGVSASTDPNFTYAGTGAVSVVYTSSRAGYTGSEIELVAAKGTAEPTVDAVHLTNEATSTAITDQAQAQRPGEVLSLDSLVWLYPYSSAVPKSETYQWQYSTNGTTWTSIAKATKSSYTTTVGDLGRQLRLRVTASSSWYGTGVALIPAGTVELNDSLVDAHLQPTTSGSGALGTVLTATAPDYGVVGTKASFQWFVNDVAVTGATASAFVLAPSKVAETDAVRVRVTTSKSGYSSAPEFSTAVIVSGAAVLNVTVPSMSPATTVKVGGTLTALPGTWDTPVATFSYQWTLDDAPIVGATAKTLKTTVDMVGHVIHVVVTAHGAGVETDATSTASVVVMPSAKGAAPDLPTFTFGGSVEVGTALTVPDDNVEALFGYPVAPAGATAKYQWYIGSSAISGATKSSFTPRSSDVGKKLKLTVTATSPYFATAVYTTPAATVIAGAAPTAQLEVTHSGSPAAGTVLSAAVTAVTVAGAKVSYQWQRSTDAGATWKAIASSSTSTYTISTGDAGASLRVHVTLSKSGYATGFEDSDDLVALYGPDIEWLEAPVLVGGAAVATKTTIGLGAQSIAGLSYRYQWLFNGSPIPGATSATFVPAASLVGGQLSARITASRAGYLDVAATTHESTIALGAAATVTKAPVVTGSAACGATLTATTGVWSRGGLVMTVDWYRAGDTPVHVGSGAKYVTQPADIGVGVFATISAAQYGYATATRSTLSVTPTSSVACTP
jgi:hypothetical protein